MDGAHACAVWALLPCDRRGCDAVFPLPQPEPALRAGPRSFTPAFFGRAAGGGLTSLACRPACGSRAGSSHALVHPAAWPCRTLRHRVGRPLSSTSAASLHQGSVFWRGRAVLLLGCMSGKDCRAARESSSRRTWSGAGSRGSQNRRCGLLRCRCQRPSGPRAHLQSRAMKA